MCIAAVQAAGSAACKPHHMVAHITMTSALTLTYMPRSSETLPTMGCSLPADAMQSMTTEHHDRSQGITDHAATLVDQSLCAGSVHGTSWELEQARGNCVMAMLTLAVICTVSALQVFGKDRLIFWRESASGKALLMLMHSQGVLLSMYG